MRVLLIADVHSNLVALQAVLEDARRQGGWDVVWNMGDIVGYGPEPVACMDLLQDLRAISVAGNHDWAVAGKVPLTEFNYAAAIANQWTAQQLSLASRSYLSYLKGLPLTYQLGEFTLVHGSPRDPIWEYLLEPGDAKANFALLETPHAAIGHSHVAIAFGLLVSEHGSTELTTSGSTELTTSGGCQKLTLTTGQTLKLKEGRWIINPGSVGQPRDGDPRAAYAILEYPASIVTAFRVEYDIPATQQRMAEAGLPIYLADRLAYGR